MLDTRKIRIFAEINEVNRMYRLLFILISLLFFSVSICAESDKPIIEIKADRTMIYPQRMELTGEETLMDILQMPDALKGIIRFVPYCSYSLSFSHVADRHADDLLHQKLTQT